MQSEGELIDKNLNSNFLAWIKYKLRLIIINSMYFKYNHYQNKFYVFKKYILKFKNQIIILKL